VCGALVLLQLLEVDTTRQEAATIMAEELGEAATTTVPVSPLLRLPAELRNHSY
jgi:hypothetical protein